MSPTGPCSQATPPGPISPNLAGRTAAAFALCAQVQATVDRAYARRCLLVGQTLYDRADTHPGQLLTASPHAYYDEHEWRDDLELGAAELYRATAELGGAGMPHPDARYYLTPAARWADAYMASPLNGTDSLNLYDVSALAHYELDRILSSPAVQQRERGDPTIDVHTSPGALEADLRAQLGLAARHAATDPFRLASVSGNIDTVPHALGNAIAARVYGLLRRDQRYEPLAGGQLDWVLGANSWGSPFVVGAGASFPRCLAHQVANLSGSLTGHGRLLLGATVDGPTSAAGARDRGARTAIATAPPPAWPSTTVMPCTTATTSPSRQPQSQPTTTPRWPSSRSPSRVHHDGAGPTGRSPESRESRPRSMDAPTVPGWPRRGVGRGPRRRGR